MIYLSINLLIKYQLIQINLLAKIKILENKILDLDKNNNVINYNYSSVNLYNNLPENSNNLCWWCCHKCNNLQYIYQKNK